MYIINPTDSISAVSASSENASYPASYVQNNFRTKPWVGGSATAATLTCDVSAGAAAVGLSYMNSASVRVLIQTASLVTLHDDNYAINTNNPNLLVNYGTQASAHTIKLVFADPGSVAPYCGVVRAATLYSFDNPEYGLSEGLEDLSIVKQYNNGALYYRDRGRLRTFSGKFHVTRDSDFYTFLHTIVKPRGRLPMMWQVTDLTNQDWVIFATLDGMPGGSHQYYQNSYISFSLIEAV